MAFNDAALTTGAQAIANAYPYLSIHTDTSIASSAAESTAPRVAAGWAVDSDGDITCGSKAFSGGAASGPAKRVGYWSAATGGTYGGGALLSGDQAFNASGEYTITGITETGTAT